MLSNVLFMLLGAGLVSVGFLTAALAERLRAPRTEAQSAPQRLTSRNEAPRAPHASRPIPINESTELLRPSPAAKLLHPTPAPRARAPHTEPKAAPNTEGGEDVITALVTAGYKKPVATEATWACSLAERATIERWAAAALARAARKS